MKRLFLYTVLICSLTLGRAQETLYANESHILALFFPSPIRQAITGAEHFTFSYNRNTGQHFGLLQANRGTASNLLVITQDGQAYSYGLAYSKHLLETHRFVQIGESIGHERQTQIKPLPSFDPIPKVKKILDANPEEELMKKGAEYLLNKESKTIRTKRKDGLALRLKELFHHGDKVYMELEIQNDSAIDFELDALEINKVNGRKGRRSSHQKLPMVPIFEHGRPNIIRSGHRHAFVYVLPKFTLGDSERLLLELHEKKGNRMLRLFHR